MSERVLHEWTEDGKWIHQLSPDGWRYRIKNAHNPNAPWTAWDSISPEMREIGVLAARVTELEAENAKLRERYEELIFAVGCRYPGKTRHETALRYIMESEGSSGDAARAEVDK